MEKRIGILAIIISDDNSVPQVNSLLSKHREIILARVGLPMRDKHLNIISLIIEGSNEQLSALSGPLGRLSGVQVKSMVTSYIPGDNNAADSNKNLH